MARVDRRKIQFCIFLTMLHCEHGVALVDIVLICSQVLNRPLLFKSVFHASLINPLFMRMLSKHLLKMPTLLHSAAKGGLVNEWVHVR